MPRVQLVLKVGEYEDGSPMWVSIAGTATYPDSSAETPEDLLSGMGVPGDEASAAELMNAEVIGVVDLDGAEIAQRDQLAAKVRKQMLDEFGEKVKPGAIDDDGDKLAVGFFEMMDEARDYIDGETKLTINQTTDGKLVPLDYNVIYVSVCDGPNGNELAIDLAKVDPDPHDDLPPS